MKTSKIKHTWRGLSYNELQVRRATAEVKMELSHVALVDTVASLRQNSTVQKGIFSVKSIATILKFANFALTGRSIITKFKSLFGGKQK